MTNDRDFPKYAIGLRATKGLPTYYLSMPPEKAVEFFLVFSRFEYALKAANFGRIRNGVLEADWDQFGVAMRDIKVPEGTSLQGAIGYLCEQPPRVQAGATEWIERPLAGTTAFERAIHAAKRVRNNLFHGGKTFGPTSDGRDEDLVRASLEVLSVCLELSPTLWEVYRH